VEEKNDEEVEEKAAEELRLRGICTSNADVVSQLIGDRVFPCNFDAVFFD